MNNIYRLILLSFFFISLISCENTNDFDLVCSYFDSLEKETIKDNMSSDKKFNYINDLISKNLSSDNPARESFNAVVGYVPAEGRYALYIDAAESTLNKSWQCESMNSLLQDL